MSNDGLLSGLVGAVVGQPKQPPAPMDQITSAIRAEMAGQFEKLFCEVRDLKERLQQKPLKTETAAFFPEGTYDADGYRYNAVVCSDAAAGKKLTVTLGGVSYTVTLSAGINQTNFPNGATIVAPDNTTSFVLLKANYQFKTT